MSGMSSSAASQMSAPSYWTNAPSFGFQPLVSIRSVMRSRSSIQRVRFAGRPLLVAMRMTRSSATQDMSCPYTNGRRPPRVSQIPSSGSRQWSQSHSMRVTTCFQPS